MRAADSRPLPEFAALLIATTVTLYLILNRAVWLDPLIAIWTAIR